MMKKRTIAALLAAASLLLLAGCGEEEVEEAQDTTTPVEIATVERRSISSENTVSGQVASGTQESVFVGVSVRCTNVYVEEGDTVSAGQVLCTLDITSTWDNYETAQMSYESAKQSYEDQSNVLSQQVAQAEKNLSDTQELFELGAASQMEVDNAQLALDNAKAGMNSALSQLEVTMQNYRATMDQLAASLTNIDRNGNVTSPISGTVLSLGAAQNSFVSPSMAVATVESTSDMEISASVSETLVPKLSEGGRVNVSISSVDRSFESTISSIDRAANSVSHLYGVTIKIPAAYANGLRSGMFADVVFYTDTQSNTVVIPTEAIQTGTDGQYVYTLDSENIAHKVAVETGLVGDGVTEITSGLSGGETLVTVGQFYLSDGSAVRVVSSEG
jgi:RND family efflux transporter MFP subunit